MQWRQPSHSSNARFGLTHARPARRRAAASSAHLWAAACRARWQLPPPREGKGPGRPPHEMVGCASTGQARRCSSWPEAYRTFHRLRRPPLLHDRVAYANGSVSVKGEP